MLSETHFIIIAITMTVVAAMLSIAGAFILARWTDRGTDSEVHQAPNSNALELGAISLNLRDMDGIVTHT